MADLLLEKGVYVIGFSFPVVPRDKARIRTQMSAAHSSEDVDFAIGGYDYRGDTGRARDIGRVPFNAFPQAISSARVNLNITRRAHAEVYASSTCRLFELAACGAAIVSNPLNGIERWFDPDRDLRVVNDADEAVAAYGELLSDPTQAEELGRRARERVLEEHTYAHRARRLLDLLDLGVPESAGV